jgi:hypothetical protein
LHRTFLCYEKFPNLSNLMCATNMPHQNEENCTFFNRMGKGTRLTLAHSITA